MPEKEKELLLQVYWTAQAYFRWLGVDKYKAAKAQDVLDSSVYEMKLYYQGLLYDCSDSQTEI